MKIQDTVERLHSRFENELEREEDGLPWVTVSAINGIQEPYDKKGGYYNE